MREKIRAYVQSNLNVFDPDVEFSDADNIFQSGLVNSLFAVQLIAFLEKEFSIKIANQDMQISNFSSVDKMVEFVEQKLAT